jgi:uncharacterized protein
MHLASNIDFVSGAVGGTIIAVSSTAFLALTGRLTGQYLAFLCLFASLLSGISGTVENCLVPSDSSKSWSWTYLAGLFSAGLLFGSDATHAPATVETLIAGMLVGFGTRMGTGCTSGHGMTPLFCLFLLSDHSCLTVSLDRNLWSPSSLFTFPCCCWNFHGWWCCNCIL